MTIDNKMNYFIDRQQNFLIELLEKKTLNFKIQTSEIQQIVFIGSGSSLNAAAMSEKYFYRWTGMNVLYCSPNEYLEISEILDKHFLIAISQTGTSIATFDCLKIGKKNGHSTFLISATEEDDKKELADFFIDLYCPEELIGPKTMGFTATFVRLIQLALLLGSDRNNNINEEILLNELKESISVLKDVKQNILTWIRMNSHWSSLPSVTISSDAYFKAMIDEGALKLLETLRVPAMSYEIGEFTHGPHRLIKESSYHIIIGSHKSEKLSNDVLNYINRFTNNTLYLSTTNSDIDLKITSDQLGIEIVYSLVFQVLSNELALISGFNPDKKVHADFFKHVGTKD